MRARRRRSVGGPPVFGLRRGRCSATCAPTRHSPHADIRAPTGIRPGGLDRLVGETEGRFPSPARRTRPTAPIGSAFTKNRQAEGAIADSNTAGSSPRQPSTDSLAVSAPRSMSGRTRSREGRWRSGPSTGGGGRWRPAVRRRRARSSRGDSFWRDGRSGGPAIRSKPPAARRCPRASRSEGRGPVRS